MYSYCEPPPSYDADPLGEATALLAAPTPYSFTAATLKM
jgi:hypothetical protein